MIVNFVDLKAQYATIQDEIDRALAAVMADTAFVSGKYARAFEEDFARFVGAAALRGGGQRHRRPAARPARPAMSAPVTRSSRRPTPSWPRPRASP